MGSRDFSTPLSFKKARKVSLLLFRRVARVLSFSLPLSLSLSLSLFPLPLLSLLYSSICRHQPNGPTSCYLHFPTQSRHITQIRRASREGFKTRVLQTTRRLYPSQSFRSRKTNMLNLIFRRDRIADGSAANGEADWDWFGACGFKDFWVFVHIFVSTLREQREERALCLSLALCPRFYLSTCAISTRLSRNMPCPG